MRATNESSSRFCSSRYSATVNLHVLKLLQRLVRCSLRSCTRASASRIAVCRYSALAPTPPTPTQPWKLAPWYWSALFSQSSRKIFPGGGQSNSSYFCRVSGTGFPAPPPQPNSAHPATHAKTSERNRVTHRLVSLRRRAEKRELTGRVQLRRTLWGGQWARLPTRHRAGSHHGGDGACACAGVYGRNRIAPAIRRAGAGVPGSAVGRLVFRR